MALKSVLITGCSAGGIGSALAESFHKRNLRVFATARDLSKMSHLEILPNVTLLSLDPTSEPSVRAALDILEAQTGSTLDYLVNNAGQAIIMPTLDFDIETAKEMYDINVWGMLRVTQQLAPCVIAAKGVYTGSKEAVNAISDTLRLELEPSGVKVVTVITGAVSTNWLSTGLNFKLPPTSVYKGIEKQVSGRANGKDGMPRMEPLVYAEKVVDDVLRGANSRIWREGYASIVHFTSSCFPSFLSDWMSTKGTGLEVFKP
ncbi:hypothetical protein G7Y79_00014g037190 [Physcia stellaris]|nr:hypothetical protein G7Y79_00014g037190 [Physcia stellaris]